MGRIDERLIATLTPPGITDPAETDQIRLLIRAWLWLTPLLVVFLGLYALNGMRFQVAAQCLTLLAGGCLLAGLRLGLPLGLVVEGSLAVTAVSLPVSALGQTPFDPSSVFFLAIVPLAATFVGGLRRGARWGLMVAVLGLTALELGRRGVLVSDPDPAPSLTMSLNFVIEIVLGLALARTYTEERERALGQARAADRAKSIFLANVSHEIRTPMNGVVGMTEVLLQDQLTVAQRAQLEVIQRSGRALVLLINDLLDVARLEEGRLELVEVRFDLRTLVADVAELYAPLASAKRLALRVALEAGTPASVRGDALRIRQVLSNLLSNAVKFTLQGTVALEVRREGALTRFSVLDTGPGIPEAVRPRLFQRFEQGDASATRRAGGTGLGLALSREFVRLMGGTLEHDARHAPGSRFTFAVALPDAPDAQEPFDAFQRLPRGSGRVLVVDDNPINLAVARSLVGNAGFQVSTACNGREALEAAEATDWSLVLMDLQMPEMDGLEAARRIRSLAGRRGQVPIIALTASAMPEEMAACRAAGMNEVLSKPIELGALCAVLQRYAISAGPETA
jgi:signal transduction histidine kinase/ActR/RegA family two-component response regulator